MDLDDCPSRSRESATVRLARSSNDLQLLVLRACLRLSPPSLLAVFFFDESPVTFFTLRARINGLVATATVDTVSPPTSLGALWPSVASFPTLETRPRWWVNLRIEWDSGEVPYNRTARHIS